MRTLEYLRGHVPEYLIEAWALGCFMMSAGLFTMLFESPHSRLHAAIVDADVRRAAIGVAMGLTAIALIHSPWGKRSGAHMNPAVTLAYASLGKISALDALGYITAQFVGGSLGVLLLWLLCGALFAEPPVLFVQTLPGTAGSGVAFAAECGIAFGLMLTILTLSSRPKLAPFTGYVAGFLVALYIGFEAPLSGMSMNPARSFASALPAGNWMPLWIYFTAPVLGMVGAAQFFCRMTGSRAAHCAKLLHPATQRCIHCGQPTAPLPVTSSTMGAHSHVD